MKKILIIFTILILALPVSAQAPESDKKDDTDYSIILKQVENYRNKLNDCEITAIQ